MNALRWPMRVLVRLLPLVIVGLASAGVMSGALQITARPSAASSDVVLGDDSSGSAMFSVPAMAPGESDARCISVSASGDATSADVRLYADVTGDLASALTLVIEAGQGGRFGDCSGFAGSQVYAGSLQDFATAHTDYTSGLAAWAPDASGRTTYRFTVSLADTATQGASATAKFVWEDQGADTSPSPSPSTTATSPSPSPTDTPTPTPTSTPSSPTPSASHSPSPAPSPAGSGSPSPILTVPASLPPPPGGALAHPTATPKSTPIARGRRRNNAMTAAALPPRPPSRPHPHAGVKQHGFAAVIGRLFSTLSASLKVAEQVVAPVVHEPGLPLLWLLLVLGFLLVQYLIDRRDPKLALAPVFADPDVAFPDTLWREAE